MNEKYILYARKSTDVEDKQVLSIEAQMVELRKYARDNGLVAVYYTHLAVLGNVSKVVVDYIVIKEILGKFVFDILTAHQTTQY